MTAYKHTECPYCHNDICDELTFAVAEAETVAHATGRLNLALAVEEERERIAKKADTIANECTQDHALSEFCEEFGCSSFKELAADIRKGEG